MTQQQQESRLLLDNPSKRESENLVSSQQARHFRVNLHSCLVNLYPYRTRGRGRTHEESTPSINPGNEHSKCVHNKQLCASFFHESKRTIWLPKWNIKTRNGVVSYLPSTYFDSRFDKFANAWSSFTPPSGGRQFLAFDTYAQSMNCVSVIEHILHPHSRQTASSSKLSSRLSCSSFNH